MTSSVTHPSGHEANIFDADGVLTLCCPCGWGHSFGRSQLLAMVVLHYLDHLPPPQAIDAWAMTITPTPYNNMRRDR